MISNKKLNNKGFGKFEVLTVMVLLMVVIAFLLYKTLGGVSSQKLTTFRDNALTFGKTLRSDSTSFNNLDNVYLAEALESGIITSMKSPVGGKCDETESKYFMNEGEPYVTLKCGDYIIDSEPISSVSDATVYKVSEWTTKKLSGDNVEEKTLYNCTDGGKEVFEEYKEDLYFVYEVNTKYGTSVLYPENVTECEVVTKTFYRTKEAVE